MSRFFLHVPLFQNHPNVGLNMMTNVFQENFEFTVFPTVILFRTSSKIQNLLFFVECPAFGEVFQNCTITISFDFFENPEFLENLGNMLDQSLAMIFEERAMFSLSK